uniref:Uncharacterized protein n=1 Tax=Arundo donax TaxID=35708 RepID=A0A0A8YJ64_ARUDO
MISIVRKFMFEYSIVNLILNPGYMSTALLIKRPRRNVKKFHYCFALMTKVIVYPANPHP